MSTQIIGKYLIQFETECLQNNLSASTIICYVAALRQFLEQLNGSNLGITKHNLLAYKAYLIEQYTPQSVNVKILAINKWLNFIGKGELALKCVKLQTKTYLNNVISDADYRYLIGCLKNLGKDKWYFVVRFLAATGARISELVQIKIEHIYLGYIDIYGKGGKVRRIYIPKLLQQDAIEFIEKSGRKSGFLFLNKFGKPISTRGIADRLKALAIKLGIDCSVVYPHSFRHRFAKNFLAKCNDLSLLADLMGHSSIQTTRIYLRKTATEQRDLVDSVIDW